MLTYTILAFLVYFAVLLGIGLFSRTKQTSNTGFIVGGRTLNFWLTALSAHASDMSAWLFMGLPMVVFLRGLSEAWIAVGLLGGMFLNWQLVAKKLRVATEKLECCTLSSFFEKRFSDTSGTIRLFSALLLVFFLTHYLAALLTGMGQVLESVFGINYFIGLTLATLVVVAYTFVGGFVSIAWTDLFQATFLLFAIILVPVFAFFSMSNGWANLSGLEAAQPGFLSFFGDPETRSPLIAFMTALSWGLGYLGMPHVITKFMGIRNPGEIKKSMAVGMSWQVMTMTSAIAIGITGAAFFDQIANPNLVFIHLVNALMHPFFGGLILCGVLAANLSTMDSQLLVAAGAIGEDIYKWFGKAGTSPAKSMEVTRYSLVAVAFTALIISFGKSATIMETVHYAWAGLGASFGPLVLTSLYFQKANKYGAIAGMTAGGLVACFWPTLNPYILTFHVSSMIPGFFLGIITIVVVSLATGCLCRKESLGRM